METVVHYTGRLKVREILSVLLFTLGILLFMPFTVSASESLRYDLTWMGIKAGEARLEFTEEGNSLKIVSRAKSAKWLSVFYRVDDHVESVVLKKNNNPANGGNHWVADRYRLKIREGRHRRNKEVIFDPENGTVLYIDHLDNKKETYAIPENTFDPLSGFFLLRKKPLKVNRPVHITIFDSKKVWDVKVDILKREDVETPAGKFRTIVVKPNMKSEGIFDRKGDIYIYLTDDKRHIPVLIKTKVAVGYVEAELVGGEF